MPYLYISHMGGLFTSDEQLSFCDLYCTACHECDKELGYAENAVEAWNLIKPYTSLNKNANLHQRYCVPYMTTEGFKISYVMNFLRECFPPMGHTNIIYLLGKLPQYRNFYISNCQPKGHKLGEKNVIPSTYCFDDEYVELAATELCYIMKNPDISTLKCLYIHHYKHCSVYIYTCDEFFRKECNVLTSTYYSDDGWYSYVNKRNISFPKCVKKFLDKGVKL